MKWNMSILDRIRYLKLKETGLVFNSETTYIIVLPEITLVIRAKINGISLKYLMLFTAGDVAWSTDQMRLTQ